VSRAIILVWVLAALPLPVAAEVVPAPVVSEAPGAGGVNRLPGGLSQAQMAPVLEQQKPGNIEKPLADTSIPEAPAADARPSFPPPCAETAGFTYGWLALSFAMLILGFVAGVVWLRERNRKKLGGMYLRI